MRFFENMFGEIKPNDSGEAQVLCPFPHYDDEGNEYFESTPSAHINVNKDVFHCKVPNCKSKTISEKGGLSEFQVLSLHLGISYGESVRMLKEMEGHLQSTNNWEKFENNLNPANEMIGKCLEAIGFDPSDSEDMEFIRKLRLGYKGDGICFPVFLFNDYMGSFDYNPIPTEEGGKSRKVLEKGMSPALWPYDIWQEDERQETYLVAGFKDAAIARRKGLNAVTSTHGEGKFPTLYKKSFEGRIVNICYDNDDAGREGAMQAAMILKEAGAKPRIVDISSVCTEKGQDIHDFFVLKERSAADLEELAYEAPFFSEDDYEEARAEVFPLVRLNDGVKSKHIGKVLSSRVSVVVDYAKAFRIPDVVEFEKVLDDDGDMEKGDKVVWTLEDKDIHELLYLADSNLKEQDIEKNLRRITRLSKEANVVRRDLSSVDVYKAIVMDDVEHEITDPDHFDKDYVPFELTLYSINQRLISGEKYRIFYKTVKHPYQASEVVGIVVKDGVETSDSFLNKFKVTEDIIESLKPFQVQEGETVSDKMEELFQRSKAFLGPEANRPVFFTTELYYHTPLDFMFGDGRKERAYLEPMIIGESRTHKSATAKGLLQLYELGTFVSMKTSTIPALIGGSDKKNGEMKTKIGVIPRNHRGAVILEEFSGADPKFIKQMTDIRSSNMVKIERVAGTTQAPAKVRMLTLSNARAKNDGMTVPLSQYPNGMYVVRELVGATEDINRYDFIVLKGPGKYIDPNTPVKSEAYPKESYMNRIRWIWSRKASQVYLNAQVREYIERCSTELRTAFECHIQLLGKETWKKLSRVAIAVAACVASISEDGESLVVKEEHVKWAKNFLFRIYDDELFNLRSYVAHERELESCDAMDVQTLQGVYQRYPGLVDQLCMAQTFSVTHLANMVNGDMKEFAKVMKLLTEAKFVIHDATNSIRPSQKFRTAEKKIKRKNKKVKQVSL